MSSRILYAAVFGTGAATLAIEIVFLRVLTPHFGSTLYVTSSVIGVVLGALALGYSIGGRLADRRPDRSVFWRLIASAGIAVLAAAAAAPFVLPPLAPMGLRVGALLASILLLTPQNVFLGTLTPYAIRILAVDPSQFTAVGRIAGNVFFVATLGSIVGAIVAGFALIPHFGTLPILIAIGVILTLSGTLGSFRSGVLRVPTAVFGILVASVAIGAATAPLPATTRAVVESPYAQLRVEDVIYEGRDARILVTDRNAWGGVFLDTREPVFPYMRAALAAVSAGAESPQDILVVGAGPYSIPQELHRRFSDARITVVDIDPVLPKIAEEWFFVETEDFETVTEDGRRFLAQTDRRFDVIVLDAFSGFYGIPPHLTTREFFAIVGQRLAPGGLVVLNSVSMLPEGAAFLGSLVQTFATSFPNATLVPVGGIRQGEAQNFLLISRSLPLAGSEWRDIRSLVPQGFVLADSYAPVEALLLPVIRAANATQ